MIAQRPWTRDRFPVLYEGNEPKAVLVDVETFAVMEMIMENLLYRDSEPEDAVLAASGILKRLAEQAQRETAVNDWEQELDDL